MASTGGTSVQQHRGNISVKVYQTLELNNSTSNFYLPVLKKYQCQCGVPNRSNISPRIIGGQTADKNEYPWQGKVYTLDLLIDLYILFHKHKPNISFL